MFDKEQKIKIQWNPNNRKYLENLGYIFEWRKEIEISANELWDTSHTQISLICDYCNEPYKRNYCDHIKLNIYEVINKDCCFKCKSFKQEESKLYKLKNNLTLKSDINYWNKRENRLNELKIYIENYRSLKNLTSTKEGKILWSAFYRNNHSIIDAVKELNLSIPLDYKNYPNKFFNDFENLKNLINEFINNYRKFPNTAELRYEYNIRSKILQKHGGIENIRKLMNYENQFELIDDNNFKNKSSYEFITAQFLIHNNVYYLREQHPFPEYEKDYRSDFTFFINGEKYHCEVWGNIDNKISRYTDIKIIKNRLYNKYNIKLISIESKIFKDSFLNIQNNLMKIFEPILEKTMYVIPQSHLITNSLSDEEILDKIMVFAYDKNHLPYINDLINNNLNCLYKEILKRYGKLNKFAEKFNLDTRRKDDGYWTEDILIRECINFLRKGISITQKDLIENGYPSITYNIQNLGYSLIDFRLKLLSVYDGVLPDKEIQLLKNLINNTGTNIKGRITLQQQTLAQQILNTYNITTQ